MPSFRPSRRMIGSLLGTLFLTGWLSVGTAEAQVQTPYTKRYYPLDQTVAPGKAGLWSAAMRPNALHERGYFQPVRVEVPQAAKVTFYSGSPDQAVSAPAPATAGLIVGAWYRLKITDITGYPGLELYPSVELLDRLHPPAGKAANYPIPLTLVAEEIEAVLEGRMVTKIVYLEQPDAAYVGPSPDRVRNTPVSPRQNAIATADQLGRPMAIVRIGGRVPAPGGHAEDPGFYGSGAPVRPIPTNASP